MGPTYRQAGLSLFPEAMKEAARRRAKQALGVCLLVVAALAALALATWSADDPSLSHATFNPVKNWLGRPGAIFADLVMQLFGFGALVLVFTPALWGWRLATCRPLDREALRIPAMILAAILAAVALATLPATRSWPLPTGVGGVVGDGGLSLLGVVFGPLGAVGKTVALVLVGALALFLGLIGSGLFFQRAPADEVDDEEAYDPRPARRGAAVPLGAAKAAMGPVLGAGAHALYSAKARLSRLMREAPERARAAAHGDGAAPSPPRANSPSAAQRIEPRVEEDPAPEPRAAPVPPRGPRTHHVPPDRQGAVEPPFVAESPRAAPIDDDPPFDMPARPLPPVAAHGPRIHTPPPPRPAAVQQTLPLPDPNRGGDPYELPALTILAEPKPSERHPAMSMEALQENARLLATVLDDFGVRGEIINVRPGPVVTLYELEPAPGTRSNRVIGLADDIARSMSAVSARVALVPGRNAIGIELPNPKRENVLLREMLSSRDFVDAKEKLPIALGKTIGGDPVVVDLAKMPHLLVAGTTGSGKSVAINTMILSLLYRLKPEECRLIMVDPKMLELSIYDGIPHLLTPVVTDPKKAVVALKWAVREMEERYKKMSKLGVRNIDGFNQRLAQARARGEQLTRTVQTGFDRETGEAIYEQEEMGLDPIPYIVVIVDEMADLMLVAGKDIEGAIQRLAQMARAAGIHLIMATQRPSVDVITGTIKANFPTRISFQVTSKIDSRTILGEQGAEQLLGRGDMLYMAGGGRISRVHGPFVADEEVERVVAHLKTQGQPDYLDNITVDEEGETPAEDDEAVFDKGAFGEEPADLYERAVQVVVRDKKASTSYIQRRLQIGYNRAASLIERMEREGVVGPANHAGKREILGVDGAEANY